MGIRTWAKRHRAITSATVIAALVAAPVTVAVVHQGFPLSDVDLAARDVWVTNGARAMTGRLNMQIEELNAAVTMASPEFDVFQDGSDIFTYDSDKHSVERVDPAYVTRGQKIEVEAGVSVSYGGERLAIVSQTGHLWVVAAAEQLTFDSAVTPPILKLGDDAVATVTQDGTVFAYSVKSKKLWTIPADQFTPQEKTTITAAEPTISAVGNRAVILDRATNRLIFDDGSDLKLPAEALQLQQVGPERDDVVVATADSVLRVGFDKKVTRVSAGVKSPAAAPDQLAAPVVVGDCIHAAWSSSPTYLGICAGKKDVHATFEGVRATTRLVFRVNRNIVALNDVVLGRVWVPSENMVPVNNWDVVTPPAEAETEESDQEATVQTFEETLLERTDENTAPIARPDTLGLRPGKTTILGVLDNDTDPDGDVLTITKVSDIPASSGRVEFIDGGRALQFVPAETASGTVSFRYTVSDGRPGGVAEAQIDVTVYPETENSPPVATRTSAVSVETGQTTSHNVLTDWIDPNGDNILLIGAESTTGDIVRYTPDGLVTFTAVSSELGPKTVTLTVSDGRSQSKGEFMAEVKASGKTKPIGTPDFVSTFVGQSVKLSPLDNDQSPSGAPLSLKQVEAITPGITPDVDLDHNTVSLATGIVGTYYLQYTLEAAQITSIGLIRVDVLPDPEAALAPIAVKDTAYIRPNEPTILNVLANDVSPSGSVLAVQRIDLPVGSQASVEILSSTVVRITTPSAMTKPEEFTYTISDGTVINGQAVTSTTGVTIVPVPELLHHLAPIAKDDSIKVRAGDIATVDVLDNDYHPDGATMLVDPTVVQTTIPKNDGLAFISGEQVRIQAPEAPGQYAVTYRITDDYNEASTAKVVISVVARDADTNVAPKPDPITTRVFQGSAVTVDVPLDGVDPDGDSVVFITASGASLGAISASTSTSFTYQADTDSSGTDEFSYEVRDSYGAAGTGTVRIAVIPRGGGVMSPTAVDDQVQIRPGRVAALPVLANDSDPNGYPIALAPKLLEVESGVTAKVDGQNVVITAGSKAKSVSVRYQVTNGHGGTDDAFIIVKIDPDAPIQPPTAVDHVIETADIIGKSSYDVDALERAVNPGGLPSDLKVTLEGPNASVGTVNADGTVTVKLGDTRRAIAYRLTNEKDKLSSTAFIVVPKRTDSEPPHLKQSVIDAPPTVDRNRAKEFTLGDIVEVPSGRPAILINANSLKASRGEIVKVDADTFRYTPEKDYYGQVFLTFTVTDGASATDKKGNSAVLTMQIAVGDPEGRDIPPTFANATLNIQPGEAPASFDLRAASSHPNSDVIAELTYSDLVFSSNDIDARLDGDWLVASASSDATGATGVAKFNVKFEDFVVAGQVTIVVVPSTRPLAQTVDDLEPDARPTSSYTISPLANDFNPFAGLGGELTIVDAAFEGDSIGASVTHTGTSVTVQTGSTKAGTISVIYTIEDDTKTVERRVQGRITVVVRSAPEPVTSVTLGNPGGQTVTVLFQPPVSSNGAEITEYAVRMSGSPGTTERTDCAPGQTCTFTGRTNGAVQTVVVDATNAVGTTSSAASTITPYGIPSAPQGADLVTNSTTAPATIHGQWAAPADNGGGQLTYTWSMSTGAAGSTTGLSTNNQTVGAGTYSFTVRACNPAGCSGDVSDSVVIAPPPPTAALGKGGAQTTPYCWTTACHAVVVTGNNWTPGSATVNYYVTNCNGYTLAQGCDVGGGYPSDPYASATVSVSGSGTINDTSRSFGFPGATIVVQIIGSNGSVRSNYITW